VNRKSLGFGGDGGRVRGRRRRWGDSWSAYVPDLPGCVSASSSREDVESSVGEAFAQRSSWRSRERSAREQCERRRRRGDGATESMSKP